MIGGIGGQGLFYFNGLTQWVFVNNYILASVFVMFTVGYALNRAWRT
jgi:hypothetical protein